MQSAVAAQGAAGTEDKKNSDDDPFDTSSLPQEFKDLFRSPGFKKMAQDAFDEVDKVSVTGTIPKKRRKCVVARVAVFV